MNHLFTFLVDTFGIHKLCALYELEYYETAYLRRAHS